MNATTENILPTRNKGWGLWGASILNGLDPEETWTACSRFFMDAWELDNVDAANLLDSPTGRYIADAIADGRDVEWFASHCRARLRVAINDVRKYRAMFDAGADEE